jgi:hypothetical protein
MLIAQIHPLLQKHKVLQRNQFAFLPGRGTHSELIQLINVLEEIAENDLPVNLTTVDVKGAFDSPERTAQYAAWRRAGIPASLAIYLVNLGGAFHLLPSLPVRSATGSGPAGGRGRPDHG